MSLTLTAISIAVLCLVSGIWVKRKRANARRELQQHSITPEALHTLLAAKQVY